MIPILFSRQCQYILRSGARSQLKMWFTDEYSCFVIKHYYLSSHPHTHVRNIFLTNMTKTCQMQIKQIVDPFKQHNQISGLQKTGRLCVQVRGRLLTTLTISSHRLTQSIGVSHSSTYRMIRSIVYRINLAYVTNC